MSEAKCLGLKERARTFTLPNVLRSRKRERRSVSVVPLSAYNDRFNVNFRYDLGTFSKPGRVLIFSHYKYVHENPRPGTHADVVRLVTTLTSLGFEYEVCNDYSAQSIQQKIKECK